MHANKNLRNPSKKTSDVSPIYFFPCFLLISLSLAICILLPVTGGAFLDSNSINPAAQTRYHVRLALPSTQRSSQCPSTPSLKNLKLSFGSASARLACRIPLQTSFTPSGPSFAARPWLNMASHSSWTKARGRVSEDDDGVIAEPGCVVDFVFEEDAGQFVGEVAGGLDDGVAEEVEVGVEGTGLESEHQIACAFVSRPKAGEKVCRTYRASPCWRRRSLSPTS
jgi:hypothetical protein